MTSLTQRLLTGALMIATSGFAAQAVAQQPDKHGNNLPECNGQNQNVCIDANGNI